MITYLYHKRHLKTGLNYFGKTKTDPYNYRGSGVYWNDHLRKHGYDVETVQVWEFDNLEECSRFALEFSKKHNIVESKEWANLCPENGFDGGDKFICMDPIKKANVDKKKSERQYNVWKTRDRAVQAIKTSEIWARRDPEVISEIYHKISNTLLNKTPEQRAETLRKRRETEAKRPAIVCPHCGKVSKGVSNMKRYHLDKCKFKSVAQ